MPPANQATPITLANTRQIGVRRTIELTKGSGGLGIGLTSCDVLTDNDGGRVEGVGGGGGERSEEEDEGEDSEYGNIHIVELHKGEEPLGIYLTHYTSPDGV